MSDVKYIFRALIGTVAFIVISSVLIEFFNVLIVSVQINNLLKTSAYQACTLFCQESYKSGGSGGIRSEWGWDSTVGGSLSTPDVVFGESNIGTTSHSNIYISGNFYKGANNQYTVWDNIFTSSDSDFDDFLATPGMSNLTNMQLLKEAITAYDRGSLTAAQAHKKFNITTTPLTWKSSAADIQNQINASTKTNMIKNMYTPANVGIPYINKSICSNIMAWETAMIFSNCDMDNVYRLSADGTDENHNLTFRLNEQSTGYKTTTSNARKQGYTASNSGGKAFTEGYVGYKGFRIYAQDATINKTTYKVYTLMDKDGKISTSQVAQLKADTGLIVSKNPDSTTGGNITPKIDKDVTGKTIYDNATIVTVDVDYSVPIAYEGITPVKKIVAYLQNHKVAGISNNSKTLTGFKAINYAGTNSNKAVQGNTAAGVYSSETAKALGVPSTGSLRFWLVK